MAPLRLRVEERITEQAFGFRASNLTRPESSSSTRGDGDSLSQGISFISHVRSVDGVFLISTLALRREGCCEAFDRAVRDFDEGA